eukprot:250955-Chlamydomonas_euryale.AAC.2
MPPARCLAAGTGARQAPGRGRDEGSEGGPGGQGPERSVGGRTSRAGARVKGRREDRPGRGPSKGSEGGQAGQGPEQRVGARTGWAVEARAGLPCNMCSAPSIAWAVGQTCGPQATRTGTCLCGKCLCERG